MNLREELNTFMVSKFANDCSVGEYEDKLLAIFKKWALEVVGEDEAWKYQITGELQGKDQQAFNRNSVKKEIRQRIEESTK